MLFLLLYYLAVTFVIAVVMRAIFKNSGKAFTATCLLLSVFFFFGAVHDFLKKISGGGFISSYRFLMPFVGISLVATLVFLHRSTKKFQRFSGFLSTVLIILVAWELGYAVLTLFRKPVVEFGDGENQLSKNTKVASSSNKKPTVFWIVMDEYSGGTGLRNGWNFSNPLDSALTTRGFFVADSATSPYNFTHYSLVSTLDMMYLPGLENHSILKFRDIVRGNRSLLKTNALELFERAGYNVKNFAIYNVEDHPSRAEVHFAEGEYRLLHNQTLPGRIKQDISWNFRRLFSQNSGSIDFSEDMRQVAEYRLDLLSRSIQEIKMQSQKNEPAFFMFHYMFTHEPFIYRKDGSLELHTDFGVYKDKYIPAVNYANERLVALIDSIKSLYAEPVIILQGDHGFKFEENDPLFEKESCSILYAVYFPDQDYRDLTNSFNSVNSFRLFFNKYFGTQFNYLDNRSFNLYYR